MTAEDQQGSATSADGGQTAIVTGGGSGIGAAAAVALAEQGWTVVVAGRRSQPLTELIAEHPELSMDCCVTDVTDPTSVHNLFARTVNRYGRVDLLFNNAGRGAWSAEIDELDVKDWKAVVDVNLTGAFLCTREAFRVMRRQEPQGGRIINNGSISAHVPRPLSVAYTATKHAITGLTKSTALDGRRYGIACGQIDIGNAATDMTKDMAAGILQADFSTAAEPRMDVADVARAVVYMASLPPEANVLTMTVMATTMPYVGRG
ncbi:MAG TPA: SDR family oxidoreductase [Microlunatus sp.]|nr:SDR family oxidoreductase [Microlunatus sp.]